MKQRYARNIGTISEEEQEILLKKTVLVVGIGGLGGYICEYLARIGVGELRICDCDIFDETNLNRQLNATEKTIGKRKVAEAVSRLGMVNSDVKVVAFDERFAAESAIKMLSGVDIVIDALDNIQSRFVLEIEAGKANVPLVFGAVSGWEGQVSTIIPEKPILQKLYKDYAPIVVSVLTFTPAVVGAYQVSEAVKVLLGRGELIGKLLVIDIELCDTKVFEI